MSAEYWKSHGGNSDVRLFLRNRWIPIAAFAVSVAFCSAVVHPFGVSKQVPPRTASLDDAQLPVEIKAIIKRSCADCHSSETTWPWYSYVAPMSWLVERDVRRGRDHMNLSEWRDYTLEKRRKLLGELASEVGKGEMPLPHYTLIHRHAKLSDTEKQLLYAWVRRERRRLREESQSLATGHRPAPDHSEPAVSSGGMH